MNKINHLEVILKISERCNLNCSYCYVFNMGSDIALNSAPVISHNTIIGLKGFLERVAEDVNPDVIQIDLHGGEPLMLKKERLIYLCETLNSGDYKGAELRFALQTNATLINNEWIAIFEKFNISVNISIDGPKHINDKYRIDHKGRSSYEATLNGYKALCTAAKERNILNYPSILSVIDPEASGKELFDHFYHDMQCKRFDFLLPDSNYENTTNTEGVKRFLIDVCDAWFEQSDPNCDVRILSSYFTRLAGSSKYIVLGVTPPTEGFEALAITVTSTGDIYIDDTLRSTVSEIFTPIGNIADATYAQIVNSQPMREFHKIESSLPVDCQGCIWQKICAGGKPVNRYSRDNAFNNKTIYCDTMAALLGRGAAYLVELGLSENELAKNIGIAEL
ncbi:cyclophane-forming radical SAM/SPASM peptide maturase XyeB [Xenorhabdus griffiniae]|uniref:Cyclophane-forming radical SAM/SPASM peptide maturase XyeB n=1 Tax=Xenorhabdus griffiniae TaxID=351672 RepID=A0ABY9XF01_9GAMM|nr:cyclophane-forming radical SAM/SPASM peptide maturase XyeB [Xenorhabdus griffiniae]MBD1226016.1 XyeB family radical SAM/SPASM peptide maturase [Xenorhabdus griffiniae]MBE8585866.1 XyeB family radical SAM/SPASM peptide maturase [Xenorhabdus griffiniae]WMV71413.1 cyclophane-forming radical SAM/SPASM peptide maturase XyeB [Xenorhabdus griffiniae]WNH01089.1 cyclophane-forming radical SAM/SPASM peptide maturase XyeB [Xenorhabdus griffiniae]